MTVRFLIEIMYMLGLIFYATGRIIREVRFENTKPEIFLVIGVDFMAMKFFVRENIALFLYIFFFLFSIKYFLRSIWVRRKVIKNVEEESPKERDSYEDNYV